MKGLQSRYAIVVAALIILVTGTLGTSLLFQFKDNFIEFALESRKKSEIDLREQMHQRGVTVVRILAENAINPLYELDMEALWRRLSAVLASPDIVFATVYDKEGHVVHDGNKSIPTFGETIDDLDSIAAIGTEGRILIKETLDTMIISQSIWIGDRALGGARIGLSFKSINDKLMLLRKQQQDRLETSMAKIYNLVSITTLVLIGGGILLAIMMARRLVMPIREVAEFARDIGNQNYQRMLQYNHHDEIGDLASSFNHMKGEIQETMRQLEMSKARYQMLLESAGEGIFGIDLDGRCTFCNPAAADLFGIASADEFIGRNIHEVAHHTHADGSIYRVVECSIYEVIKTQQPVHVENELFWRDNGSSFPVEYRAHPIYSDGGIIGTVVNFADISRRREMEASLRYRNEMERLVSLLATRFINLPPGEIDNGIKYGLAEIGTFTFADRSYLFLMSEEDATISNNQEWCKEGIEPKIQNLRHLPIEEFNWLLQRVEKDEIINIPLICNLREEENRFRELLVIQDTLSMLLIPLRWGGRLRGFAGFDAVRRVKDWSEEDITFLSTIANIFANALERRATDVELRRSEASLNEAQRIAHVGSWELDLINDRLYWSDVIFSIFEIDPQSFDASYNAFLRMVHPQDLDYVNRAYTESVAEHSPYDIVHRLLMSDGRIKYVHERGETYYDEGGTPLRTVGTLQDITAQRSAEERLRQSAIVFENTNEGVFITNADKCIIDINRAFSEITGYQSDEVLGQQPLAWNSASHSQEFYQEMWASLKETGQWRGEVRTQRKTGEHYPQRMTINRVHDAQGRLTNYIAVFADISFIKESEAKLEFLAQHDPLTGLPNRLLFGDRLAQSLKRTRRTRNMAAVMFLDLDRFKHINDSLGHSVGDILLKKVAKRLSQQVRGGDTVARLGGDEFTVLMENLNETHDAVIVAEKLLNSLTEPFNLEGRQVYLSTSIGISLFPSDGENAATLLSNADAAMYRAKESGRNAYRFFTSELTTGKLERVQLEAKLRQALKNDELRVYYQPQVDLNSGQIIGAEALIRWQRGEHNIISPDNFVPLAEETGLIVPLGEWVLDETCRQGAAWLKQGLDFNHIAVNIAGAQIKRGNLDRVVHNALQKRAFPAGRLVLEVTEGFIMGQASAAIDVIQAIRDLGVKLAIDDFGTGYSSLSYLKRLPINILKIDQSFVRDLPSDTNDLAISRAIIALAHSMQLDVIAEGVESDEQRRLLLDEGCYMGQGHLFHRPLSALEFSRLLTDRKKP